MELLKTKGMKTLTVSLLAAAALLITVLVVAFRGASASTPKNDGETLGLEAPKESESIADLGFSDDTDADGTAEEIDETTETEKAETTAPARPPSISFISNGDGTCSVSGIGTITSAEINVPTLSPSGDVVTGISEYAFYNCTSIVSIDIPSTVRSIGKYAFLGCTSLLDFSVSSSNNSFKTVDGVLYSKDGTRLICYPAMRGKTSCVISADVTVIESGAFSGVKALKNIYYTGSAADWTAVMIGSNNEVLESIRLTCNYKE